MAKQQEEKYEAKMTLLNDRVRLDLPLTEAEWAAWRQWMGLVSSSSSSARRRKRKKRRKRKLPKCGCRLFPPGCGRPCDHQQVPAVQVVHVREGAPASVHRQIGGHSCFACRDVYPQCVLCRPPPDIGSVGFGSSPFLDTKHTIYELSLPSERGCPVSMSCGGGGFLPDGAYDSVWDSVKPVSGKYFFNYFQCQEAVGCICMLNYCFSSYDEYCPDIYNYSRFKLKDKCRSVKWEVFLYGDSRFKLKGQCRSEKWEVYLCGSSRF